METQITKGKIVEQSGKLAFESDKVRIVFENVSEDHLVDMAHGCIVNTSCTITVK